MSYSFNTYHFFQQSIGIRLCAVHVQKVGLVLAPEGAPHPKFGLLPEPDHHLVSISEIKDASEEFVLLAQSNWLAGRGGKAFDGTLLQAVASGCLQAVPILLTLPF